MLGANELLTPEHVDSAVNVIRDASVLLCQFEIPLEATLHALKLHRGHGAFGFILFFFHFTRNMRNVSTSEPVSQIQKEIRLSIYCIAKYYRKERVCKWSDMRRSKVRVSLVRCLQLPAKNEHAYLF